MLVFRSCSKSYLDGHLFTCQKYFAGTIFCAGVPRPSLPRAGDLNYSSAADGSDLVYETNDRPCLELYVLYA